MAKQNVTFIERHVEKFVVGVCGAVLLGVAVMYLVQNPHHVEVSGEPLGPSAFYAQFREKADQALNTMKRVEAHPQDPERIKGILVALQPVRNDLPDRLEVAFVPASPPVPKPEMPGIDKRIDLAKILAPAKPMGGEKSAGRSVAKLPEPTVIATAEIGAPPPQQPAPGLGQEARDTYFIVLASTINRKAQREAFDAAGYNQERLGLRITGLDVERQMLLPGGEWGPSQQVEPYAPGIVGQPPQLTLVESPETSEQILPPEQVSALEAFRSKFGDYSQQSQLLRPSFQPYLENDDWWEWWVPKAKELGIDGDMTLEYGVQYPDEVALKKAARVKPAAAAPNARPAPAAPARGRDAGGEGGGRGGNPGRGAAATPVPRPGAGAKPAAAPVDPGAAVEVTENFKKAEEAINNHEFIQAAEFLHAISTSSAANEFQKNKALKQLDDIKADMEQEFKNKNAAQLAKLAQMQMNFGPDVDPIWFTDTSVIPGKTFRYRIRLMAINNYAALPNYLTSPADALKVVVPGEWSEWSDPVTAKPDKQLFASKIDNKSAQLDLYQWSAGKWQGTVVTAGLGEPITGKSVRTILTYDATISSIEQNRPYRERKINKKDGSVMFGDPKMTQAIVLVNSRGEAEEHLLAEDIDRKKTFANRKVEEEGLRTKLAPFKPNFQAAPAGMQINPGPNMGRMGMPGPMPGAPGPMPAPAGQDRPLQRGS